MLDFDSSGLNVSAPVVDSCFLSKFAKEKYFVKGLKNETQEQWHTLATVNHNRV